MTRPFRPPSIRRRNRRTVAAVLALALVQTPGIAHAGLRGGPSVDGPLTGADLAASVDPRIGTLGSGFEFPGPQAPFGMVQLSPDTEGYFAYTGYLYSDAFIRGFSHVHVQAMGVPEGGNIPFMPVPGAIVSTDVERYQAPFSHADEVAEPGYYRVQLGNGVTAELTAGERVGMHRYTFPKASKGFVLMDVGRDIPGGPDQPPFSHPGAYHASVRLLPDGTVVGTANQTHMEQGYAVHFAARFDRPIEAFGVYGSRGAAVQWDHTSGAGLGAGAAVRFDTSADPDVMVKVGISFVDQAGAIANLNAELPGNDFGFDALRARTRAAWNDALGAIRVKGGLPTDRTAFTTALYHAMQHPNVFDDADGRYLGYDGLPHRIGAPGDPMPAGADYYANFSLWDTYRGEMQLLALVAPDRFRDMMTSLNAIRRWGGRMPRWGLMDQYADFMNGEPALQTFADAYCRGLVPAADVGPLYDDAVRLALQSPRDPSYLQYGYVPYDVSGSGASSTLEDAIGDFALALVADRLGHTADRDALLRLAGNWRNVFDPATRFVRPRKSDGSWITPYHPELPDNFREGTGWQYTWLVPHDVAGLFSAMGGGANGDRAIKKRMDTFFATRAAAAVPGPSAEAQSKATAFGIAYYGNQYAPSNEHDLHAPYLYDWTRTPWKTQALIRGYQALYRATPDGLPGNDDLGSMSAWYVWSALGFYPAIAGAPVYVIGSPVFAEARIRLPGGGTFTVRAPGTSLAGKYVQSATLGGAPLDRTWFTHSTLTAGGGLTLQMGPFANTAWASGANSGPPSQSTSPLSAFGCTG